MALAPDSLATEPYRLAVERYVARVPRQRLCPDRIVTMPIPPSISGQKYMSLTTFRKSGAAVPTPVWFAENDGKLYVMTRSDSGKYKRLRNNPQVRIAPCTMRGKVTGPNSPATVRVLPEADWPAARHVLHKKYWLARLPIWSKKNVYLEIVPNPS